MKTLLAMLLLGLALLASPATVNAQPKSDPKASDAGTDPDLDALLDAGPAGPIDPVAETDKDPVGAAGKMVAAIREGNWRLAAAFALSLIMLLCAKARQNWKLFAGKRGGAFFILTLALGAGLATSIASGMPVDWKMFAAVFGTAWTAVGGYTWVRDVFGPQATDRAATDPNPAVVE